ncbi:MAG: HNH endonuclease [Sphaerochaetaceae bacterium]
MQREYFERYLKNVRRLKSSTVEHYKESLRKIASVLHELGYYEFDSLFDVDSYDKLREIEQTLKGNREFVALDERGNRMYSAGFHRYMEFAEGKEFFLHPHSIALVDYPCPVRQANSVKSHKIPNRDNILVRQVLQSESFKCEINPEHQTFVAQKYHTPFMEGHHLIPLNMQPEFGNSLDVYANILSLCPTCHRFLHFGLPEEKVLVLKNLFDQRKDRLVDSGIRLGEKEFLEVVEYSKIYVN